MNALRYTITIPNWQHLGDLARAQAVIDKCQENGIDTASVNDYGLAAAVREWEESLVEQSLLIGRVTAAPADYVHIIRIIVAYLAKR